MFEGDRAGALVTYVYDEASPAERRAFEAHLATCAVCREDLAAFESVRTSLDAWEPPAAAAGRASRARTGSGLMARLRAVPAWAQVAAALLLMGVSLRLANLDIRYGADGLSVRTGWLARQEGGAAPWSRDLADLEAQFRAAMAARGPEPAPASASTPRAPAVQTGDAASGAGAVDSLMRRVRALVEESERRQQRELALRAADIMREVQAQRQADLARIDRSLNLIQTDTGMEVRRQREWLNYMIRVSQQR
jgi:hypothetical protein